MLLVKCHYQVYRDIEVPILLSAFFMTRLPDYIFVIVEYNDHLIIVNANATCFGFILKKILRI